MAIQIYTEVLICCIFTVFALTGCDKSARHPIPRVFAPDQISYITFPHRIKHLVNDPEVIKVIVAEVNEAHPLSHNIPDAEIIECLEFQYKDGRGSVYITHYRSHLISLETASGRKYYAVRDTGWFDEQVQKIDHENALVHDT